MEGRISMVSEEHGCRNYTDLGLNFDSAIGQLCGQVTNLNLLFFKKEEKKKKKASNDTSLRGILWRLKQTVHIVRLNAW